MTKKLANCEAVGEKYPRYPRKAGQKQGCQNRDCCGCWPLHCSHTRY